MPAGISACPCAMWTDTPPKVTGGSASLPLTPRPGPSRTPDRLNRPPRAMAPPASDDGIRLAPFTRLPGSIAGSGVLDLGAVGQAGDFDSRPRRSIPELEAVGVQLVHHPHGNLLCQVGIDENHVAQIKTSRLQHGLDPIERGIHLRGGV